MGENRQKGLAVRGPPPEARGHGHRRGDEDREEEGVVEPTEGLRVDDAKLNEDAEGEVRREQGRGAVEDHGLQATLLP